LAKNKKGKKDDAVERARKYDRERRRSDAREHGSGGIRTRSEDQ